MSGIMAVAVSVDAAPVAGAVANRLVHTKHHRVCTASPHPGIVLGTRRIGLPIDCGDWARSAIADVHAILAGHLGYRFGDSRRAPKADVNTVLETYLEKGVRGLTCLTGEFILAVWDGRSRELIVITDRHGLWPHYYAVSAKGFVLSPEVKATACLPGLRRTVDRVAIAQCLRFQHLLGERTFLNEVKLLPPAALLRYRAESGQLTISQYWNWTAISPRQISLDDAADELLARFQHAVTSRVHEGERAGVFLSGGLDSRLIAACLTGHAPATAVTFGVAGSRDVHYAKRIARAVGMEHRWFPFDGAQWVLEHAPLHLELTEGFHSWMHMHGISLLEDARALMDVNLTGWCGGTSLRGIMDNYDADRILRAARSEGELVGRLHEAFCRRFTWPGLTDAEAEALTTGRGEPTFPALARESLSEEIARTSDYRPDIRADIFYLLAHVRRQTQYFVVFKRSAVHVRCPYFDGDVMDFVYSLPVEVRCTPDLYRKVLTRCLPSLARIPGEADLTLPHERRWLREAHRLLPRGAAWLRRHGIPVGTNRPRLYADYEEYLRTDLRAWGEALLFDRRTTERGFFNSAVVRSLWERHQSGRELWTIGKIAPLMAIEQVMRYLIEDEGAQTAAVPASVDEPRRRRQ